jgi:putative endopeptidase
MTSDTPAPARTGVLSAAHTHAWACTNRPEATAVNTRTPKLLILSLAVAGALAACGGDEPAANSAAAAPAAKLTLDESKLPAYNAFTAADLDPSIDACTDFGGYVNNKWLAANAIPGDRTSWGAFTILDERSVAVQHQLAEQAAAMSNATGIEKIVGDLWATGMDETAVNAAGLWAAERASPPEFGRAE